jgi:hypothetical protein
LQELICKSFEVFSLASVGFNFSYLFLRIFLQQFHEWLANKVCPWPRTSPSHSPHNEDLAQRLEAKLSAAEQKRYFFWLVFVSY